MSVTLDHIVILVSHEVLDDLPAWLTESFTILEGGRHSDGITENKLILFQDGVYIELIAFLQEIPTEKRASARWGLRSEGEVVDFALTLLPSRADGVEASSPEDIFHDAIQARMRQAQADFDYLDPVAGGRMTPDGTELRWAISVPSWTHPPVLGKNKTTPYGHPRDGVVEGELPFWCLDRTLWDLRVPFQARRDATEHTCGAAGVRAIELYVDVDDDRAGKLQAVYESFLGEGIAVIGSKTCWKLDVPAKVVPSSDSSSSATVLTLQEGRRNRLEHGISTAPVGKPSIESQVRISLAMFTSGAPRLLSGKIGPRRLLEIRLVKD